MLTLSLGWTESHHASPGAHLPRLANCLNNLGIALVDYDQQEALKALHDYEAQRNAGAETYTFDPEALGIRNADFWRDKNNEG